MIKDLLMVNNMETWNFIRLHFILSCFQLFWWYIFVFARALKCKIFTAFLLIYGEIDSHGNPRSATRLPDTSLTVFTMITMIRRSAWTQASPPQPLTPWCWRAVCGPHYYIIMTGLCLCVWVWWWPRHRARCPQVLDPGLSRRQCRAPASAPAVTRYRGSVVHWL